MSHPDVPEHIETILQAQSPAVLHDIARRATDLAETKLAEQPPSEEDDSDDDDKTLAHADLDRDQAPAGATLTTKTIHDNDYYYWQWREGDTIKSEYIKPVSSSE